MWCADIEKWVADLAVEGLLFVKMSTKLDIHSLLTGSAAGPLAWSEIDPAHRAFDASGPTKPNFQRPDRAGQRCKCRLVQCDHVSGYVRLLQSQYESKSARTVLKIISQNLADGGGGGGPLRIRHLARTNRNALGGEGFGGNI